MGWKVLALFVTIIAGNKIGFVDSVPVKFENGETITDDTVQELENLKTIAAKVKNCSESENDVSINESRVSILSNVNGHKSAHKEAKDEVVKNGELCGKFSQKIDVEYTKGKPKSAVETEVEIPSEGMHYVMKTDADSEIPHEKRDENSGFKKTRNELDIPKTFSEIKYSPHHMAEYIFWTGDEKGVALAIEEFLQEGLMSREEAINFLQSVKYNLDNMQSQYQELNKEEGKTYNKETLNRQRQISNQRKLPEVSKVNSYDEEEENSKLPIMDLPSVKSDSSKIAPINKKQSFSSHQLSTPQTKSSARDYAVKRNRNYPKLSTIRKTLDGGPENYDDYDEVAERLKVSGVSQNERSLEEIIFELAEIMFSESLTKGNLEAQKATQRFSSYLQKQVEDGQISRKLQRKIFGILSSALVNVISEHPELLNRSKEELQVIFNQISPPSEALKQLLLLGTKQLSDQDLPEEGLSEKTIILKNKKLNKELINGL